MKTPYGHLSYCSNIHPGESWNDHFAQLQQHIPFIKERTSPGQPFGIGLRLANTASLELQSEDTLIAFQQWLKTQDCYVFTMNGFPYGGFHHTVVKDKVHAPDWTTVERVQYTIRLAQILARLLPEETEGGISTSPLSYCFWHTGEDLQGVIEKATLHLLQVVEQLIAIRRTTGKLIHLDIEPEPDGLLGEGKAFFDWYAQHLLPLGLSYLQDKFQYSQEEATAALKDHVQLCYDVCHFAVGYEDHGTTLQQLQAMGIKVGKIQISAALKAVFPGNTEQRAAVIQAFQQFNEPVYLHQVVARQQNGSLKRYADLPDALADAKNDATTEWRAHFHVPLFVESYGVLQSTQKDIEQVLAMQKQQPFTSHLEVETYTWEVLPEDMRLPINKSIVRELEFVQNLLKQEAAVEANNHA
ncbi:metabolite traffic protein EboE [Flavitalea antarctica]